MDFLKKKRNWIIGGILALAVIVLAVFATNGTFNKKSPEEVRIQQLKDAKGINKVFDQLKIGNAKDQKKSSDTFDIIESSLGKPRNSSQDKSDKSKTQFASWNSKDSKYSLTITFKDGIAVGKLLTAKTYIKNTEDFATKAKSLKAGMSEDEVIKVLGDPTVYQIDEIDGGKDSSLSYFEENGKSATVHVRFDHGKATTITGTLFSNQKK